MNNIAPKLQECWTHKIAFKIMSKMRKKLNFFHSQPSKLPNYALAKFYLSTPFGLSSMISSVAPTPSSTFYSYLIIKIGNRNLKLGLTLLWLKRVCEYPPPQKKNSLNSLASNRFGRLRKLYVMTTLLWALIQVFRFAV